MTTTISALTTAQPANADVFEFEVLNASSGKATRANVLTAATAEAISLIGNSSSSITISAAGAVAVTLGAASSGSADGFQINIPSSTGLTASTDVHVGLHIVTNSVQHATGAITTLRDNLIEAVTHTAVAATVITSDGTLVISGAPIAGTNVTITNPYALWVQAGISFFAAGLVANNLSVGVSADTLSSTNNLNLNCVANLRLGTSGFIVVTTTGDVLRITAHTAATTPLLLIAGASQSAPLSIYQGGSSRTGALVNLQTSAAGSLGNVGGTIFNDFADGASTHTDGTEDTLYTHTTVANTLANNGDRIAGKVTFQTVAHATATRRIQLYFAGTVIWDSTAQVTAAADTVELRYEILMDSATSVRCTVTPVQNGTIAFTGVKYTKLSALTLTGTNVIKITGIAAGTGAAASDIVAVMQSIDRGEFGS